MDFEDHREAAIGGEVGWERHPGLDLAAIGAGGDLEFFHAGHVEIGQDVRIEGGQDTVRHIAPGDCDIGRRVGRSGRIGKDRAAGGGDGEVRAAIGPADRCAAKAGQGDAGVAVQADLKQVDIAGILDERVKAAAIRGPDGLSEFAVKAGSEFADVRTVSVHQVEIVLLIRL